MAGMSWEKLLYPGRFHSKSTVRHAVRSPFLQDLDRIVFSRAFRMLQDKTQVHPFGQSGMVHSRLTHSIEVASVGRSLGAAVAASLRERNLADCDIYDVSSVTQVACLAHDIGNPPFGHVGERTIRSWFRRHEAILSDLSEAQRQDLFWFDGNCQGFRILTRQDMYGYKDGGLRLTAASLAAFMKYPRLSLLGEGKYGILDGDREIFKRVAEWTGLLCLSQDRQGAPTAWARHPLTFLMEAADDICYSVVDIEDAVHMGLLNIEECLSYIEPLAFPEGVPDHQKSGSPLEKLTRARSTAINALVEQAVEAFVSRQEDLLSARQPKNLLGLIPLAPQLSACKDVARQRIYPSSYMQEQEFQGSVCLEGLLGSFMDVGIAYIGGKLVGGSSQQGIFQLMQQLSPDTPLPSTVYEAALMSLSALCSLSDHQVLDTYRRIYHPYWEPGKRL